LKVVEKADVGNTFSTTVLEVHLSKSQITIPMNKLTEMNYQERMMMRREKYDKGVKGTVKKKSGSLISAAKK
jgi:hypothetical protein